MPNKLDIGGYGIGGNAIDISNSNLFYQRGLSGFYKGGNVDGAPDTSFYYFIIQSHDGPSGFFSSYIAINFWDTSKIYLGLSYPSAEDGSFTFTGWNYTCSASGAWDIARYVTNTEFVASAEYQSLKTSVSDGKSAIASAITGKGGSASGSDTFAQLATAIGNLGTVGIITDTSKITGTGGTDKTLYVSKTALSYVPNNYLFLSTESSGVGTLSNSYYQVAYFGKINGSYYMEAYSAAYTSRLENATTILGITTQDGDSLISYTIISIDQNITTGYTFPFIMIYW